MKTLEKIKDLKREISDLEDQLKDLKEELSSLEKANELELKWSADTIKEKIIKAIKTQFGENHQIKTVIFKPNGVYNDETYDYESACLILVDKNFNEVDHKINPHNFIPNEGDQRNYYEAYGEAYGDEISVDDLTFKL